MSSARLEFFYDSHSARAQNVQQSPDRVVTFQA
jgi:hypothetical protein